MAGWHKREQPVDRAMRELERQLSQVRREIRQLANQPVTPSASANGAGDPTSPGSTAEGMTTFVRQMLVPARKQTTVTYRSRKDLFDVADSAVTQLEIENLAVSPQPAEPDLFGAAAQKTAGAATPAITRSGRLATQGSKLMDYLSAGSIRSYKPLRRVQREERNRFFAWLGVALAAVWLIWAIVR